MPIPGDWYEFSRDNVDNAPDTAGVYALYEGSELIYYGRALGTSETIRSRLQSHYAGREGACTRSATHYRRVWCANPATVEVQLLNEYKGLHGRLPRCNERRG